jgi:hypothetical protein
MNEYHKIKNALTQVLCKDGYKEVKPDTDLDVYGSVHSIYALGEKRFMIGWDGEEGFGFVEQWEGKNQWAMLTPILPEESEANFEDYLTALCAEVKDRL